MPDVPVSGHCPSCGAIAHRGLTRSGLCPACLLKLAFVAGDVPIDEAETGALGASYRVLTILEEEIDRTVFLAEQRPGRRLVTLDITKPPAGVSRVDEFRLRLAALQRLDDTGIALVIDGRVTPEGAFCTVCRYTSAPRVSRFCDASGLSARERSGLFAEVCRAIAHAHDRGVAHGRLRPDAVAVVGGAGAWHPLVTGFGMWTSRIPSVPDDLAGLASIARAMGGPDVSGQAFDSVPELREAVAAAWPGAGRDAPGRTPRS